MNELTTKYKVLIVDDQEINLLILEELLAQNNIEFISEKNSNNIQKLIDENKFDLILLDVLMPGISGLKLFRKNPRKIF